MTLQQCAIDNETLRDIDIMLHDMYPEMVYGGDGPWNDYGDDWQRDGEEEYLASPEYLAYVKEFESKKVEDEIEDEIPF